ncbi:hypothetical protein [Rhizobium sophoriradicis]|uniref:Uncharacterized protein n=1 Tax=Rhizobium sophoriradicis TaxID=1535245 RepID=A0A2A5KIK6_9HYPH|nr:hypothetical protein [Rhizobium sophoriradicis]PCK76845.1 hypothetical protein CPT34_33315 [Rhizobium sophoriradicis]
MEHLGGLLAVALWPETAFSRLWKRSIQRFAVLRFHKAQGSAFRRVIILVVRSKLLDRTMLYTAIPANSKIGTEFFWMTLFTADSSTGNQDSGPYSNAALPVYFDIATAGARLFHQRPEWNYSGSLV